MQPNPTPFLDDCHPSTTAVQPTSRRLLPQRTSTSKKIRERQPKRPCRADKLVKFLSVLSLRRSSPPFTSISSSQSCFFSQPIRARARTPLPRGPEAGIRKEQSKHATHAPPPTCLPLPRPRGSFCLKLFSTFDDYVFGQLAKNPSTRTRKPLASAAPVLRTATQIIHFTSTPASFCSCPFPLLDGTLHGSSRTTLKASPSYLLPVAKGRRHGETAQHCQ